VAGWLAPLFVALSAVLLGRAHYVLYVLKQGTYSTTAVTWVSTVPVVVFWTWKAITLACVEHV